MNKQEVLCLSSQLDSHEPNLTLETQKKMVRKTVKIKLSREGSISEARPSGKLLPMLKMFSKFKLDWKQRTLMILKI